MALTALLAAALLPGCGGGSGSRASARSSEPGASGPARWQPFVHVRRPLDLAGPRADGAFVLAAGGRLWLLSPSGRVQPFAPGYRSPGGEEPYIALPGPRHPGCSFGNGTVYVLKLTHPHGVLALQPSGAIRSSTILSAAGLADGIAFDETGSFGYRLLVTVNAGPRTTVYAIGCDGKASVVTSKAPRVEGGIAVAPKSFGRFAGDLIASDEAGGRVFAIAPDGSTSLLARSGLPHGGDVGVESEAFVGSGDVYVADRLTPGNPHPGDDVVLRITAASLRAAGIHPADLLVTTEGGAHTDAISCRASGCSVRHVADGPAVAHAEGHIGAAPR